MRLYFTIFAAFIFNVIVAQRSDLTGILRESNGEPLIFVPILNKTTGGIYQTDIDGRYFITCKVGDELSICYIGFNDVKIIVTKKMMNARRLNQNEIPKNRIVSPIKNSDFRSLLNKFKLEVPNVAIDTSIVVDNLNDMKPIVGHSYQMKSFKETDKDIQIVRKGRSLYYGTKLQHTSGMSFIQDRNLPALQTSYGSGIYINGQLDATASQFSWGKQLDKEKVIPKFFKTNFFHDTRLTFAINDHYYSVNKIFDVVLINTENKDLFNVNKNYFKSLKVQTTPFVNKLIGISYEYKTALSQDNNTFGYYSNGIKKVLIVNPLVALNQSEKTNPTFPFSLNEKNELLSSSHILTSNYKKISGNDNIANTISIEYGLGKYQYIIPSKQSILLRSSSFNFSNNMEYEKIIYGPGYQNYLVLKSIIDFSNSHFNIANNGILTSGSNQLFIARNYIGLREKREHFSIAIGNNLAFSNWQKPLVLLPFICGSYQNNNYRNFVASAVFNRNVSDFNLRDVQAAYTTVNSPSYQYGIENTFAPFYIKEGIKNEVDNNIQLKAGWNKTHKFLAEFSYNFIDRKNAIWPVWDKDKFLLDNAANFETHALKLLLSSDKWSGHNSTNYGVKVELMKYFGGVNSLTLQDSIVFLYGFQNASKVWIENEALGTIYGYDYKRNKDGVLIIDEAGFPIKNNERSIIGNTTPDLSLSLIPHLQFKSFLFEAIVNAQIGGQVWDGTSSALDYHGASKASAIKRKSNDYVYPGFTSDHQQNSKVVQLDNQENSYLNRWMRHGEDGVSIDGIRNASHLMIKMLKCTYKPIVNFRDPLAISLFTENIITVASYQGFTNTPLLDINSSNGINYFNRPIQSSIGLSLTLKI